MEATNRPCYNSTVYDGANSIGHQLPPLDNSPRLEHATPVSVSVPGSTAHSTALPFKEVMKLKESFSNSTDGQVLQSSEVVLMQQNALSESLSLQHSHLYEELNRSAVPECGPLLEQMRKELQELAKEQKKQNQEQLKQLELLTKMLRNQQDEIKRLHEAIALFLHPLEGSAQHPPKSTDSSAPSTSGKSGAVHPTGEYAGATGGGQGWKSKKPVCLLDIDSEYLRDTLHGQGYPISRVGQQIPSGVPVAVFVSINDRLNDPNKWESVLNEALKLSGGWVLFVRLQNASNRSSTKQDLPIEITALCTEALTVLVTVQPDRSGCGSPTPYLDTAILLKKLESFGRKACQLQSADKSSGNSRNTAPASSPSAAKSSSSALVSSAGGEATSSDRKGMIHRVFGIL